MSSFYDDASLVVIPSGYKTSKVYAEKPTDGSGDLAFTRTGDTATRVNSAGLIEKVRTNLVLQSQTFDNAYWDKLASSVNANATIAPDGTLTAEKLVENSANDFHAVGGGNFAYSAGEHSWSVFAKAGERNVLQLLMNGSLNTTAVANFNLTTGVVSLQTNCVASIESIGNGWFRCSMVYAATAETVPIGYYSIQTSPTAARATTYLGDGTSGLFVWGAQMTMGVTTAYIPTTTAAVSVGPVANVPRLDYLGSTCPRLLLEPQRTNLVTYSEQINNAAWGQSLVGGTLTLTPNYGISPDGYQNADRIQMSVTTGYSDIVQVVSTSSGTAYTYSVYLKSLSGTPTIAFLNDGSANRLVTLTTDWQRYTFTISSAGSLVYPRFLCENGVTSSSADFLAWGAQLEAGAYATSYIPTLAASSTRGADACSKTGISSLIGQTEGTIFVDFRINGLANFGTPISVNNGSAGQYIWLTIFSNGDLRAELYNGAAQASITYSGAVVGGRYKMAFGYKTNDFVLYVNGTQVGTDNSGTTFSGTTLSRVDTDLANASLYSTASESINQALVFKTRLSNAELASLTSL